MSEVRFYYDGISQPSRAVWLLLNAGGVKYESCRVDMIKGEIRSRQDFRATSAASTVPAIDDNGFHLFESVAIMKYLISKYNLPDHWYPSDLKQRARVDEFISWHHGAMHWGTNRYLFYKHMCPKFGMKYTDEDFAEATKTHQSTLRMMEEHFLKDTKFIHSDQISIADLLAVCEFTQFWMTDEKDVMSGRPKIAQWLANVQSALSPYFDEVHEMVFDHKKLGTFCSGSQ